MNSFLNKGVYLLYMKKPFWLMVQDLIRRSDVVLEVLDARMPDLTRMRRLEEYTLKYGRKLILVINKIDLVSRSTIKSIKERYSDMDYILISSKFPKEVNSLIKLIKEIVRRDKIRVAFVGYPNTGKSSLINTLSRHGRARSSAESGFTRGLQLIAGRAGLMLIDTPGVIPFGSRDEIRLGLVSGISPSKLENPDLVAYKLIDIFKKDNPSSLKRAYGVDPSLEAEDILIEIAKKMNMFIKGGVADENRAAIRLLMDWHKGKIRL